MSKPSRRAPLVLLLLLALVQLACARGRIDYFDTNRFQELYRRRVEPKPRIPGSVSTVRDHATSVAPMRLTARDGTGLALRALSVRGVIDEPLSHTELHLTFENPHDQTLDGQFEILLPSRAEVSRFALMVGGQWIESEVVEREQARQIYQDHKHTRRDPALLERERGRRFSGRIFPIAPRERKQIILSYAITHEQAGASYRVPLAGLPRVDELDVQVVVRRPGATAKDPSEHTLELHGQHQAPREDFVVPLDGPAQLAVTVDNHALLRVVPIPADSGQASERPAGVSVLVDTSASMAGTTHTVEQVLEALFAELDRAGLGELPLELLAFDQTIARLHAGTVAGADARVLEQLRRRPRLGASDLAAAISAVGDGFDRIICVCDGELTAGATTRFELGAVLDQAALRGLARIDAIMLDPDANLVELESLVSQAPFAAGQVFAIESTPPRAWIDDLLAPPSPAITLSVPGAAEVWPAQVEGLRPGQAVLVHASFARAVPKQLSVELGGALRRSERIASQPGDAELAGRAIAVLRVNALIDALNSGASAHMSAATKREIIELSKRHRILGDYTAMLALDSERAYESYGIERGAPAASVTIAMEDSKQLPVGKNTSRDFTSVVDIAPTAGRDAASISLAGTTGALSPIDPHYQADGANIDVRLVESRSWLARASGRRVGPLPAELREPAPAVEAALDQAMLRCARHIASNKLRLPRWVFEIELGFDATGQLIRVVPGDNFSSLLRDCATHQIHALAGADWAHDDSDEPAHRLRRRYHMQTAFGPGDVPEGWQIPGIEAFIRSQQLVPGQGSSGWARFIEEDLADGLVDEALDVAWTWHQARPDDLLPYVSLGRALAAAGQHEDAARAYGSLIDLQPSRAETRRFAGALLESLGTVAELELAIDSFRKARALRPDHPTGYQALAWALARHGDLHEAVEVLVDALGRTYTAGRFGDVVELLQHDLATLSAAAILAEPESRAEILALMVDTMVIPSAEIRDHLMLSWETDASSLSLGQDHGEQSITISGDVSMSAWVPNGYGPQGLDWREGADAPLVLVVYANNFGPESRALGSVRRMRFEGDGQLRFETRPFVIWPEQQFASIGLFEKPS